MTSEWIKDWQVRVEVNSKGHEIQRYCLDLGNFPIDIVGSDEQGWEVFSNGFFLDRFKSVQEAKVQVNIELEKLAEFSELNAKEIRQFLARSERHITQP